MKQRLLGMMAAVCLAVALLLPFKALAQVAATYQLTDSANAIHQVHGFSCLSGPTLLCLAHVPIDSNGNAFGVSANPFFVAPGAGQTFPISGNISCSNCSGSGVSATFGAAIGSFGAPAGFKDGSGNFQPLIGDTTNGQKVNLGGTLPGFASTPTVNLGTIGAAATQTTLAAVLSALGSPFQAAGSIGNTTFGATQPTAANLNATVVGPSGVALATSALQTTGNTSLGTIATNSATQATAANQTNGTQKAQSVDASGNNVGAGFATTSTASITRSANTTTYTPNTGWNNGTPTFFSFTAACRVNGGQVLIPRIDIWSSANPTLKLTGVLYLFAGVPGTNISDDATFTIASADFANLTGNFGGLPFSLGNNQASGASNSSVSLTGTTFQGQCAAGSTTITGMVEVTNAYVPASAEVLHVGIATTGLN